MDFKWLILNMQFNQFIDENRSFPDFFKLANKLSTNFVFNLKKQKTHWKHFVYFSFPIKIVFLLLPNERRIKKHTRKSQRTLPEIWNKECNYGRCVS